MLYIDNDGRITLDKDGAGAGVEDADGVVLTGATVEVTGYRSDRATELTGPSWPQTMAETGSGTGVYQYVLDTADLTNVSVSERIWLKVTLDLSGRTATWWKAEMLLLRN